MSGKILIKNIETDDDLNEIISIYEKCYDEEHFQSRANWEKLMETFIFKKIAVIENKIIGFLTMFEFKEFYYLEDICILPSFQNKGVGTKLLNIANEFSTNNKKNIALHCDTTDWLYKFYKKNGYFMWKKCLESGSKNLRYFMIRCVHSDKHTISEFTLKPIQKIKNWWFNNINWIFLNSKQKRKYCSDFITMKLYDYGYL